MLCTVMGRVLNFNFMVMSLESNIHGEAIQSQAKEIQELLNKQRSQLTDREVRHAEAALLMAKGCSTKINYLISAVSLTLNLINSLPVIINKTSIIILRNTHRRSQTLA